MKWPLPTLFLLALFPACLAAQSMSPPIAAALPEARMDPYFTAINYPVAKDTMTVMLLPDFLSARTGHDFFTTMEMAEYGITSRWSVGFMAEEQKILGLPATFGGLRFNTYFRLLPHDHLLNVTLYAEYEHLNQAALYKMEVAGFGGEDLVGPLSAAGLEEPTRMTSAARGASFASQSGWA